MMTMSSLSIYLLYELFIILHYFRASAVAVTMFGELRYKYPVHQKSEWRQQGHFLS